MKIALLAASCILAASAAQAQSAPTPVATASRQQQALRPQVAKAQRRAGDRPVLDRSMDRLVVEPTHSTITLTVPSPAVAPSPLADQSRQ